VGHGLHVPEGAARQKDAQLAALNGRRSQVVDKFNDLLVTCYTTAGHARLLLLHDSRVSEEANRIFFQEVHELYLKERLASTSRKVGRSHALLRRC
jgi:hypothetical protein